MREKGLYAGRLLMRRIGLLQGGWKVGFSGSARVSECARGGFI